MAQSHFDAAERQFRAVSADQANAALIRGFAIFGLAETAAAKEDSKGALRIWRSTSEDTSLPLWQRDLAKRRANEMERVLKGLPARDQADYRVRLPALPPPATVFHVSPAGNEAGDGSAGKPFTSLAQARDAIRALKKANGGLLPKGGVQAKLAGGSFLLKEPLRLTAEDSGTADSPVVYRADEGAEVVFEGGAPLRGWTKIRKDSVREKLDPAVRDRVLVADLKANGITDWGDATVLKKRPELFANGQPQTLARWPNEGFIETGEILGTDTFKVWGSITGCKDGKFRFLEERPKSWLDEPDVRLYGYWFWDWFEEYQRVSSIDPAGRSFTLSKPYSNYGYRKGQRYFAVNILRELDHPGEWYLDRRDGKLYWLPPEGLSVSTARVVLSVSAEPFLTLDNVEHLVLIGLTFQESRGDGIRIRGGRDCLVAGCTLRRLGGDALIIEGGLHHGVFGCSMHTLGCGAMRVNGGDRQKLLPGGHFVENCTVSNIARIKRTYAPAVHLDGCCNRIAHNLFEHIPSSAMRIEGNDHLIELNQVRHVVEESDDQGGIDMYGNPLYRGVLIRWNQWSDIIGGTECGAAGIRLDDMISGIVLYGNLFERCGAVLFGGVQIHGGKENVVDGNAFLDCHAAFSFSRWDQARWIKSIEPFLKQAGGEPYATRYPALAQLKSEPNVNFITRNLVLGCRNVFLRDGGVEKSVLLGVTGDKPSPDLLSTGSHPLLQAVLFEPLPLAEMGPYAHPWKVTARTGVTR